MTSITIKRGASLDYRGQILENNAPKDITDCLLTSEIRTKDGKLIDYFAITITNAQLGEYSAVPSAGTANYPIETLCFDIKLTANSGQVVYSETALLTVTRSFTQ